MGQTCLVDRPRRPAPARSEIAGSDRAVGFRIMNTNPSAASPVQSFITDGDVIATAPCHRDERDALLVQLRGTEELLMHPPAPSLPGCPADLRRRCRVAGVALGMGLRPFLPACCVSHFVMGEGRAGAGKHGGGAQRVIACGAVCGRRRSRWRSAWPCESNRLTNVRRSDVRADETPSRWRNRVKRNECVWEARARRVSDERTSQLARPPHSLTSTPSATRNLRKDARCMGKWCSSQQLAAVLRSRGGSRGTGSLGGRDQPGHVDIGAACPPDRGATPDTEESAREASHVNGRCIGHAQLEVFN